MKKFYCEKLIFVVSSSTAGGGGGVGIKYALLIDTFFISL